MTVRGERLARDLADASGRIDELVAGLAGDQWIGPALEIVNPPLWEVGHVAWFTELWVLRRGLGRESMLDGCDAVYDSMAVAHTSRWRDVLPPVDRTLRYLRDVTARVLDALAAPMGDDLAYRVELATFHADMHAEALLYSWQTHGYRWRWTPLDVGVAAAVGPATGDVEFAGGEFLLGAARDSGRFVFDNEKWVHSVRVAPFALARAPVTEREFAAFVDDGGYRREELWTDDGWRWLQQEGTRGPACWRAAGGGFEVREFERWRPLDERRPVVHVNFHEAEAWCRWAGRRLPTEAEWEFAACDGRSGDKPRHPWRSEDVAGRANLDSLCGTVTVDACVAGDTASGLRQVHGNVWEWTSSAFAPFPGFAPDLYRDYSAPWFHSRRVLRGGFFATRSRMLTTTHRNFFTPDRRDVFAGFRTAAPR